MGKKRTAHLVQVVSDDEDGNHANRVFYAVLTVKAEAALRLVKTLCQPGEQAVLARGALSVFTARALGLQPNEPRRL